MKRTLSLLAVLAVAGFAGTPVQAASHYYASGMGGVSWMEDIRIKSTYSSENYTDTYRMDPDIALLGAYGWNYGRYRLEGEIGCHRNNFKSLVYSGIDEFGAPYSNTSYPMKGHLSVVSLMANGYYDIPLGNNIKLYGTAGVGGAQVSYENVAQTTQNYNYSVKVSTLACQIGAGFTKPVANDVTLDLRYRYFATPDFTVNWDYKGTDYSNNTRINSHSILLGLRVGL
jgi:opacity protein-like surface antigen